MDELFPFSVDKGIFSTGEKAIVFIWVNGYLLSQRNNWRKHYDRKTNDRKTLDILIYPVFFFSQWS